MAGHGVVLQTTGLEARPTKRVSKYGVDHPRYMLTRHRTLNSHRMHESSVALAIV
jgi:hypothetical protein